ncbi:MAG: ABC transporter substrate-binding protein [Alphaproteobacteria bacterium]|nr:ABC transporter substrate-binding protein [Alphaproteobacteria bacterium]
MTSVDKRGATRAIGRRSAIKIAAGVGIAALSAPAIARRAWGAERLVVADPGGPYSKGFLEAFHKPFMQQTGIEIVGVARSAAPVAQVRAMVETKAYQWDVVYLAFAEGDLLSSTNLLDPIDTKGADYAELPPNLKNQFYSATDVFATTLGYNKDKYKANAPRTWADFWNVEKFPGRRSMRKRGYDTPEQALMADGVAPADVYKVLDTDAGWQRMFKKMDAIRKHINVWWDQGSQASQLIKSGEVDMIASYAARTQAAIDDGAPFAMSWDQGFYDHGGFSIIKGNPKAELARKYIAYTANAQRQGAFTQWLKAGPSNPGAYKYIEASLAKTLPTHPDNFKHLFEVDTKFWAKWKAKGTEMMNEWLLKG